jgi:hypothetical protein
MIGILGAILVGWSIYNVVLFFRRRRIFPWSWICLNGVLIIFAIIGVVYDPAEALGRHPNPAIGRHLKTGHRG